VRKRMSTLAQKATLHGDRHMSALPQKSDIRDFNCRSTRPSRTRRDSTVTGDVRCGLLPAEYAIGKAPQLSAAIRAHVAELSHGCD